MKIFHLVLFLIVSLFVNGQKLHELVGSKAFDNAMLAISVADVETGEAVFKYNSSTNLVPASVQKLVTTATALELLGPEFTFETKIAINGQLDDGILHGDLIIVGGGDPTLGSKYFNTNSDKTLFLKEWAQKIKEFGISEIEGDLIVDATLFQDVDVPKSWIWEDLGNYYGAAAKAISVFDNTFEIEFATGENDGDSTKIVSMEPNIYNLIIKNEVLSSSVQRDLAYVFGDPNTSYRTIRGTLPKNRKSFKINASIPNPVQVLAHDFVEVLTDSSVWVDGNINYSYNEPYINIDSVLFRWKSPKLDEIVQQINFESVNLFAENFGKYLGVFSSNKGTTAEGIRVIQNYWDSTSVKLNNWYLADASGLSRVNSLSAETLTDLLVYMVNESENAQIFKESIPVMGQNGTQKYYFQNSVLNGKARAKSGSMKRVRSFAGYMETKSSRGIAFSVIANNFKGSSMQMAHQLEGIIEAIYEEY